MEISQVISYEMVENRTPGNFLADGVIPLIYWK